MSMKSGHNLGMAGLSKHVPFCNKKSKTLAWSLPLKVCLKPNYNVIVM